MTHSHRYGPHRPEDAPNVTTVLGAGKWPRPELRPMPSELVAQRERINEKAQNDCGECETPEEHRQAIAHAAGDPAWCVETYACSCGSWHFYVRGEATCPDGEPVGPHD